MNGLMTAGRPAGALLHAQRMIGTSDQDSRPGNLLEMAFHAQVRVPNREHFCIDGPVRRMANGAALA